MSDTIGHLYSQVCNYLWEGSVMIPTIIGFRAFGVKPNNYCRWDAPNAESTFANRQDLQPADMPYVTVDITDIATNNMDSCGVITDISFNISIASGQWRITNATPLYSVLNRLISNLIHTGERCSWDIVSERNNDNQVIPETQIPHDDRYAIVDICKSDRLRVSRDKEISKNQSGHTLSVSFAIRVKEGLYE